MAQSPDPAFSQASAPPESEYAYPITDMVAGGVPLSPSRPAFLPPSRLVKALTACTLLSSLAGLVWGSHLAAQELKIRLENEVGTILNRPVEWGGVRGLSPLGIRLGKTTIPTTADNPSSVTVDAIDITFDWRALLKRETPRAHVTLVRPHLSLIQNPRGDWSGLIEGMGDSTARSISEDSGGLSSNLQNLDAIHIQDGQITIATQRQNPRVVVPRSQLVVEELNGSATILHDEPAQPIAFALTGQADAGGFKVEGQANPGNRSFRGTLQTLNLPVSSLNLLLPDEFGIEAGVVNGNLTVSADLEPGDVFNPGSLDVQGSTILSGGSVKLGQLPEPVSRLRASLWFQGNQVNLHNTGFQMGNLALRTEGTVSLVNGYNLLTQIPTIGAADIQNLVDQKLPATPDQTFQWQARVTGPLDEPLVEELSPPPIVPAGQLPLNPKTIGLAVGLRMANLPMRDRIPLIEDATYTFRPDGAWFTLSDGTVVPPLSRGAYQRGATRLNSAIVPTLDRKFFWLLQSSPYITAIAADLGRGQLRQYLNGNRFDTDRFFVEYFIPVYRESSYAAGLDPGEALWMLDHSLRTLQDPLLRTSDATPITSGSGTVGSFWRGEQVLSMQQLILRPQLVQPGRLGDLTRSALLKHLDLSTSLESRRLASTPEVMSKLPNVTFGAEEGAIAHALGIVQLQGPGIYSEPLRALADRIVQNEFEKQQLRSSITEQLEALTQSYGQSLGETLVSLDVADWKALGLGPELNAAAAAHLNGTNALSVLVSRNEKAGYSLNQAYGNSRALLLELLQEQSTLPHRQRLLFALLKDHTFNPTFWQVLSQRLPGLSAEFSALVAMAQQYEQLAVAGSALHEQLYAAMVQDGQDISVNAAIKHAVGFQAHLAQLIDQAFAPADPADPRYLAFRRSLAIYLRESPDISVYGGTEAALRLYGHETLNVQEMLAVDVAAAPRIRALARLYTTALQGGMISQWDVSGFQRILLTGALLAAGVERDQLPADLAAVGFPSAEFKRDLLFAVGPEGIKLEATRLGVQAHDHRVSFQPVAIPAYRAPSFDVTNPQSCPTQPEIQAIVLGPQAEFVWYPTIQQVVLNRGDTECPLYDQWQTLFFDTLLETAAIVHSPAGAADLQAKLREAQLFEAGIF
jgi:translocation and assembly module TamB